MKKTVTAILLALILFGLGVFLYSSICDDKYCGCDSRPGMILMSWTCSCAGGSHEQSCTYILN